MQNHALLIPAGFSRRENSRGMRPLRSPHGPCWTANDTTRKTFLLHTIRSTSAGLKAADVLQDPMSVLCKGDEPLDHPFGLPNHSPPGNNRIVPLHNVKQPAHESLLLGRRNPPQTLSLRMRTSRRQRRRDRFFLPKPQALPEGPRPRGNGGARRDRTDDIVLAKHALSQLSYGPDHRTTGPGGLWRTRNGPKEVGGPGKT